MAHNSVTLYTIGHSNRPLEEFLALLTNANIVTLVDVRARPEATRWRHFSGLKLARSVERSGISYRWEGNDLGGFRAPSLSCRHIALDETLRGFAEHMATEAFRDSMTRLVETALNAPTAIMCAEKNPDHCHRRMIADYLKVSGSRVAHLIAPGITSEHQIHPAARQEQNCLIYDRMGQRPLWTE